MIDLARIICCSTPVKGTKYFYHDSIGITIFMYFVCLVCLFVCLCACVSIIFVYAYHSFGTSQWIMFVTITRTESFFDCSRSYCREKNITGIHWLVIQVQTFIVNLFSFLVKVLCLELLTKNNKRVKKQ